MKSLSISDRKKLSSLYERYGYDNILRFNNVLNESFSSNVLFELNRINSAMHIGIDGQNEKPLSPIGAAFMKAFPIPWDKVTDDMIEMYADNKMFPYLGIDDDNNKQIRDKNYVGSLKTSSYVSNSGKLDTYRDEFMDLSKVVRRCIRKIEKENISISTKIGMSKDELNFIGADKDANYTKKGFDEWINSTSKLSTLYHYNKDNHVYSNYIILTKIEMLLRFLIDGDVYSIDAYSFNELKESYKDIIFDNNTVNNELNYLDSNIGTAYNMDLLRKAYGMLSTLSHVDEKHKGYRFMCGIPGFLKTRDDVFDKYDSMDSVMYPTVADMIKGMSNKQINYNQKNDEQNNQKPLMSFDDASTIVHAAGYSDKMTIRDFSKFYNTIASTEEYDNFMSSNDIVSRRDRDRLKNVFYMIYDKIRGSKRTSKEYAGAKLISTIYNKMNIYGKSNSTELNSIPTDIFSYYKDKDNTNGFRLYILTDKRLKILYVVSCIKANVETNNGYSVTTGLYGWRYGDKPDNIQKIISDMSNDKHIRTKSGGELYKYSTVSEGDIKNDRNLACAFVISSKNKDYNVNENTFRQINKNIINTIRGAYNIDVDNNSIMLKGGKFDSNGEYLINMLDRNDIDYTIDGSVINLKVDDANYGRIRTLLENMKGGIVNLYDTLTRYAGYENAFTDIDADFDTLYNNMMEEFGCIDNGIINIGDYDEKKTGYKAIKNAIDAYNAAVYAGTRKKGIYYYYTTVGKRANSIVARRTLDDCRITSCQDILTHNTKKIIERINDLLGFSFNSEDKKIKQLNINMKSLGRDIIYSMQIKRKSRENLGRTVYANAVDYSPAEKYALVKADELENMKNAIVDAGITIPNYKRYIEMIDRTIYEWPFGVYFGDFTSRIDDALTKLYTTIKGKVGYESDINHYYNIGRELFGDVCFMYKYVGAKMNDTIEKYLADNSDDYENYKINMDKVTEKNIAKCNNKEIVAKLYSSMMQIYNKYNTILTR